VRWPPAWELVECSAGKRRLVGELENCSPVVVSYCC
jgi:hypothetical protein